MKPKKSFTTPFYVSSVFSFGPIAAACTYFILHKKQLTSKGAFWKIFGVNALVSVPFLVLVAIISAASSSPNAPVWATLLMGVVVALILTLFCAVLYCVLSGVFVLIAIAIRSINEE